jgi:Flp pilus assembly protein TadG
MRRRRRTGQAGQVAVLTALMATLIFGGMALAVDLSVHTFNQRTLQNVADSAALAGATDLGAAPTTAQQQAGIADAMTAIRQNIAGTWSGAASTAFTNSSGVSGYMTTVTSGAYTGVISSPPQTAKSPSNATSSNLEVDLSLTVHNGFAGVLGVPTSVVGAHAVGYHSGPPSPYNYTFFSAANVESGNQQESIYGDAFVGNGYKPQSSGQAGLCVYETTEATPDTDDAGGGPDNDLDDQGHVAFSAVAPSVGNDPAYLQNTTPCPGSGQFNVQTAQSTAGNTNCPPGSTAATDGGGIQCVMPNPAIPAIALPTPTATLCAANGNATIKHSTLAGIYQVGAGCSVKLDFAFGDINCVDLVLGAGATVAVNDKKSQDFMTSYDFSSVDTTFSSADTTGLAAINNLSPKPTDLTTTCPGASGGTSDSTATHTGLCIICSNPATGNPTTLSNSSTGCCSDSLFVGTIFLPGQTIDFSTNQSMEDVGQIYCGDWLVQSGNHPNPLVTRDSGATDLLAEALRLVE